MCLVCDVEQDMRDGIARGDIELKDVPAMCAGAVNAITHFPGIILTMSPGELLRQMVDNITVCGGSVGKNHFN